MSRGEWAVARRAGVPDDRISLEGVGKTDADLRAAIRSTAAGAKPLLWVALESADEARGPDRAWPAAPVWGGVAGRRSTCSSGSTPRSRPETIAGLAVGDGASKFGMTETEATGLVEWLATHAGGAIRPRGVHLHVGSQLRRGRRLARRGAARTRGRRPPARQPRRRSTRSTSAAGSRCCRSTSRCPAPERFARELPDLLASVPEDRRPARLAIEPGRALVARSGWLVARVLHVRERGGRQVVIDAGMTELIRPALYGARHPIVALTSLGRPIEPDDGRRVDHGRADARRGPDLRVDRRPRHARPAAAPPRRPRRHQRRRRLRRLARLDLQRPARGRRRSSSNTDGTVRHARGHAGARR